MQTLLLSLLLAQEAVPAGGEGKKVAYVVGIDRYEQFPLERAVSDARRVAAGLAAAGFLTRTYQNLDLRGLGAVVDNMEKEAGPGTTVFFYFAGHGFQIRVENYLAPRDFRPRSEADAPFAAYHLGRIQSRLDAKRPRATILVLDACRNNPFQRSRALGGGLAAVPESVGSIVMFATGDGKTAADSGLFAQELATQLRSGAGKDVRDVFRQVKERVYTRSGKAQIPYIYDGLVAPLRLGGSRDLRVEEEAPNPGQETPREAQSNAGPRERGAGEEAAAKATALLESVDRLEAALREQQLGLNIPLATARTRARVALAQWKKEQEGGGASAESVEALTGAVKDLEARMGRN